MMESKITTAFKEQNNLIALAIVVGLSVATLNPIPLLIGAIAEAGYLLFIPDTQWYNNILQQRANNEKYSRRHALKQKVFEVVDSEFKEDFSELEFVRQQLNDDYMSRPDWRDVIDRLDTLLSKYLEFGLQNHYLRQYISNLSNQAQEELPNLMDACNDDSDNLRKQLQKTQTNAKAYSDSTVRWVETEMASVRLYFQGQIRAIQQLVNEEETRIAQDLGNANNKDTLLKRIDIQTMSLKQAEKIGQGLISVNQQMALMAETVRLINGQIRSKQPGQVLLDVDNLIDQSETVSNFLQDIAPFEEETQLLLSR